MALGVEFPRVLAEPEDPETTESGDGEGEEKQDDGKRRSGHGRNYTRNDIVPTVAVMTLLVDILPGRMA